jgi:phosphoglycolate phosphatase
MKYRLIAFDWDGTIMDSTGLIADCIQRAASDCGLTPPSTVAAKHIIGLGIQDSVRHLFPTLTDAEHDAFAMSYRGHYLPRDGEVLLYSGIETLLAEVTHSERFLAVATGKPRRGLERAFANCGLKSFFHYSRCADEGQPKPHPEMLETLMRYTGVGPTETLMIGDTTHDLDMAAAAGCAGLGVSYGAHSAEKLRTSPSCAVLHSVEELREWLRTNA